MAFIVFTAVCVSLLASADKTQKYDKLDVQRKTIDLKAHQLKGQELQSKLEVELKKDTIDQERIKQLEEENNKFQQESQELQRQLQAKAEAKEKANRGAVAVLNTVTATRTASAATSRPGGSKEVWLRASGIPESEWWAVDYIVSRESGWNPCAYNPGKSDCNANPRSACGLAQSYPCGKVPGHWTDPVANLKWQYQYVKGRYGGYAQAVAYWKTHHNY